MSYDAEAFLRYQVQRGMTFAGLCRAYGATPRVMRQTLERARLLRVVLPEDPALPSAPLAAPKPEPIPARLARRLTPRQQELYRLLRKAAAGGELCPSAVELASHLRIDIGRVQKELVALVRQGAAQVRVVRQRRVVTILETGQSTAEPEMGAQARKRSLQQTARKVAA